MRRQSRELTLQYLFQSEFAPKIRLSDILPVSHLSVDQIGLNYCESIVDCVLNNKSEIDTKIQNVSRHWKIDRMASVDRNILRIAVAEMYYSKDPLAPNIAINEAIEIAKIYGTKDSASFVNGLLDQIVKTS